MQKTQKRIVLLIFLLLIIGSSPFFYRSLSGSPFVSFEFTGQVVLLFFTGGNTAENLLQTHRCKIAVNGGYFDYDEKGNFIPAGIWIEKGENLYQTSQKENDPNLQNTLYYQDNSLDVQFFFDQSFPEQAVKEKKSGIFFNAGPRVLQDYGINEQLKSKTSHRNLPTQRTILAKKENQIFLLLFKDKISLSPLAELLKDQEYEQAINLDGGPSTSFASEMEHFNEKKVLPIFFCWR